MTARQLYLGPMTDNRRWDSVTLRAGDVIVATPPKCGTTWMQTIVALLLSGDPDVEPRLATQMPWVDLRLRDMAPVAERLEAMAQRRCMKSHTPMDGLPFDPGVQYFCVFRHPLDAHFSFRPHTRMIPLPVFKMWYPEDDPENIAFGRFLDGGPEGFDTDLMPLAHILRHYTAAKALSDCPNVTLLHYADMTRDLPAVFDRVATQLDIHHAPDILQTLIASARFDHMRDHAARYAPLAGTPTQDDAVGFFDSGTSGKWHGALTEDEYAAYDRAIGAALSAEDRAWLEFGETGRAASNP